jgi:hypothetical protein
LYGLYSEEVEGGWRCEVLEFMAMNGAGILGVVGFVDVLAGDCWYLGEQ